MRLLARFRFLNFVALFWLVRFSGNVAASAEAAIPTNFNTAAIDAYVASQVKELGIAGVSLAILRDGQVVLAKGYGFRSLEPRELVTTNTLFAIGSITKQFTCACIFLLAEEGKLSIQDKVAKYFPELTRANDITLRDLMNHVSGYPDYYPLDFVDRRMATPIAVDDLIRQYAGGKLDFAPGTRWSYSNTGFVILGRVIEKVSGDTFQHFLRNRILARADMKQTAVELGELPGEFATGYISFALGPVERAEPEARGWIYSAGSMYCSALDLAKWDMALIGAKVLTDDSYKTMTTPRKLTSGKSTGYGCGLGVSQREGFTILSHNGAVNGFAARNAVIPASKSAVVLLSSTDRGAAFAQLHNRLISLLLQEPAPSVPKISGGSAVSAAREFFDQLQKGSIERKGVGEEFSIFLDDSKVKGAAQRLAPYGRPVSVEVQELRERGEWKLARSASVLRRVP